MKKGNLWSSLLKGLIVAAGTGAGMMLAKCFSVEEEEPETEEETDSEIIDVDFSEETEG